MTQAVDPAVSRYMTMVKNLPPLDREAELSLARRWKRHGDEAARDALVRAQLRSVVAIALKYRRYGLPLSELIAEGNFGLVHALTKFDPERGYRLVTYATFWIRAYVLNYTIGSWSLVGAGSGALRSKMFFKLRREHSRVLNLVGTGEAADKMLAERLDVPEEKLRAMLTRLDARDVSLDAPMHGESERRLVDMLPASERDHEEIAVSAETSEQVRDAVQRAILVLNPRERYIVEQRLLADTEDEVSLAEIGRHLGISRERARQIEARAKHKLRAEIMELERAGGFDFLDLGNAA